MSQYASAESVIASTEKGFHWKYSLHYIVNFIKTLYEAGGNYATIRKVTGSIRYEFIGFFNRFNRSSSTMALGSTQPLTEMKIRNLPGVKGGRRLELASSPPFVSQVVYKMWEPRRLTTLWASAACYRDTFTFLSFTSRCTSKPHQLRLLGPYILRVCFILLQT
jgi:hypothetical protein